MAAGDLEIGNWSPAGDLDASRLLSVYARGGGLVMASLDWSQCPAVESVADRRSGAWVFRGTRMPVATVFENLELGTSIE